MSPQLLIQPLNQLSTVQLLPLGTVAFYQKDQNRSAYRYVQFGGTSTINPGLLLVAPAAPSNSTALALNSSNTTAQLTANNPASSQVVVTNGATAVTAGQFTDGVIQFYGSGVVESHRILGNSADSSGSNPITVEFDGPLLNTLTVGTQSVNLRQNAAYNCAASTTQAKPVGVTIMSVPNTSSVTNYGWVKIFGEAYINATSATKGYPIVQDTSGTAGYIANTGSNLPAIGIAQESAANGFATVDLNLF